MGHSSPFLQQTLLLLVRVGCGFFVLALCGCALLFVGQHEMIYHPRRYDSMPGLKWPESVRTLTYSTSAGHQYAYYLPPKTDPGRAPDRLWVLFCGNASLAHGWLSFLDGFPEGRTGFLLIDYPGYGSCEGRATPVNIQESAEAAFAALARQIGCPTSDLERHLGILGHSLGCATGLNFAAKHPVDRALLLSPFTSMHDMARRTVGWPLCYLTAHLYDNRGRLGELAARQNPPEVIIFHGVQDQTIPAAMGEELARLYPQMITLKKYDRADHASILSEAWPALIEAMRK